MRMCCRAKLSALILKKLRFALLPTCLCDACTASPQAQQPTSAPENNKPAISLRVTTRLVQVNVVVNDKNGKPIVGLGKVLRCSTTRRHSGSSFSQSTQTRQRNSPPLRSLPTPIPTGLQVRTSSLASLHTGGYIVASPSIVRSTVCSLIVFP